MEMGWNGMTWMIVLLGARDGASLCVLACLFGVFGYELREVGAK